MMGDFVFQHMLSSVLSGDLIETRNSKVFRRHTLKTSFKDTPLVCVRKTAWKQALREMEWFLSGSNHIDDLDESVTHWWKPWVDGYGRIPNNYGRQFRYFSSTYDTVDQIQLMLDGIRDHPTSRRNVITTWHAADMADPITPITNCHGTVIQAFSDGEWLDLTMYQRSADMVLGLPHNWIQYWALLLWLAHHTGKKAREFHWIGGDCHIYEQHADLARRIIQADIPNPTPQLIYTPTSESFLASDFSLSTEYNPVITEKAEMVV